MDVVCSRCRAEYEFDDALISKRGTTVRCTKCGLQFKVYAGEESAADELWRVYDPHDQESTQQDFESFGDLQRAIVRGSVNSRYYLVRGERIPRPLSRIMELQPLLRQRNSERPPSFHTDSSAPDTIRESLELGDEIVPSCPPEAMGDEEGERLALPPSSAPGRGASIRIRSALSVIPDSSPPEGRSEGAAHSSGIGSSVLKAPPPLRQTLSSTPEALRQAREQAEALLASEKVHSSERNSEPEATEEQEETNQVPSSRSLPEVKTRNLPATALSHSEPRITEVDLLPRQLTPTPGALRAYRSVDTAPMSSIPGVPVSRHARSGALVLSVLVGAVTFLAFANRNKIIDLLDTKQQSSQQNEAVATREPKLDIKLDAMETSWVRYALLQSEGAERQSKNSLAGLVESLSEESRPPSWDLVNVLRAQGSLIRAREEAGELSPGTAGAFALALLDLAEAKLSGESPPWPLIVERLKEASSGERGQFFARTVYIYSLVESGEVAKAGADFEAFSKLKGAKESPLYRDLLEYLKPPSEESALYRAKATEADGLWQKGEQKAALDLYREIVRELGASHELGRKAKARIKAAASRKSMDNER